MLAILTDLHANREAVAACLEHAERQGAQRHAFLGDLVGYGADPAWVVDTVMAHVERGAIAVLGNHDLAAAEGPRPTMSRDARDAIEWTRAQLSPAQLDFLGALPLRHDDGPLLFVHANGWAPERFEYITRPIEAGRSLTAARARITFCGHVHDPRLYHMGLTQRVESFVPVPGSPIPLGPPRRWLAIPGSTGQPRDGNPAACYALFDEFTHMVTWWRVPYDYESAARKVRAADLSQRLASRLEGGV
jgi:diadenosine tetraphosphatase ApaH/serine/threonine PP2A family protein phosphatase